MNAIPYRLKLKKISSEEQRLIDAIYSYLPSVGFRSEFERGIKEAVAKHVGGDFSFELETLQYEPYSVFLSKLPQKSIITVLGMLPLESKALIEIDTPLALLAIDKILGGPGESIPGPRELSDTEQGVLQYILLQILAGIHERTGKSAKLHFRFEKFSFGEHEIRDQVGREEKVAVLCFRVNLGRFSGFVRLVLPRPFVEEGLLNVPSAKGRKSVEVDWALSQLKKFEHITVPLSAEAGRTTITAGEVLGLEEGDVILFENSMVSVENGKPSGRAWLRVGTGLLGGFDVNLETKGNKLRCHIHGVQRLSHES